MPIAYSPATCPDANPAAISPVFDAANLFFFALAVSTIPLSWIVFFVLRDTPRLKIRSLPANVLLGCGVMLYGVETGLRRTLIMDGAPCWTQPVLVLVMTGVVSSAVFIRVFAAHSIKMRYHLKTTIGAIQFDAESSMLASALSSSNLNAQTHKKRAQLDDLMSLASDVTHLILFNNVRGDPNRLLVVFEGATEPRALILVAAVLLVPALVAMAAVIAATPLYAQGCTMGCASFTMELYIGLWVVHIFYVVLIVPGFVRLLNDEDATGTIFELKLTAMAIPPFALLGLVLIPLDPNDLNARNVFNWEWFLFAMAYSMWFFWTPWQIGHALKDRFFPDGQFSNGQHAPRRAKSVVLDFESGFTLEKLLLDDDIYNDFLKYCELNLQVENCRFIRDVAVWKSVYFSRTQEFRSLRAKSIAKLYLANRGSLEINVSGSVKKKIIDQLASGDVDVALFDKALLEVSDLLRFTLWVDYEKQVLSKRKTKTTAEKLLSFVIVPRQSSQHVVASSPGSHRSSINPSYSG